MSHLQCSLQRCCLYLLCVTTLILTACSSGNKPETVINDFLQAVAKKEVEKAIDFFDLSQTDAGEMVAAKGKLQMIVGQMSAQIDANNGLDKVTIVSADIAPSGQEATVRAKLVFKNKKDKEEHFKLRNVDGKWKIVL